MNEIKCRKCGKTAFEGANFCPRCGAALERGGGERRTFLTIDEANAFLRNEKGISRLKVNFVCVTEMGLAANRTRLERVELMIKRGGRGELFQLAGHDYVRTFPFDGADIRTKLTRLNPDKKIVSIQSFTRTDGRALMKITGAGGIKHERVYAAYVCGRGGATPFVF